MFDYEDNEEFWNRIEFKFRSGGPDGNEKTIEFEMKNQEYYPAILDQLTYFLQAIGYNYIHGLVAINEDGEDLKSSLDN